MRVNKGAEQRRGENFEIQPPIDAALADERHGLASNSITEAIRKFPLSLQIGGLRRRGDDERFLSYGVEQRRRGFHHGLFAGGDDKKFRPAAATSGRPNTGAAM